MQPVVDARFEDDRPDPDDEPGPLLRFLARHPLPSGVAGMLLVSALWRASVLSGSWFGADDFVYQSRAHQLGVSRELLTLDYFGQLMPGGFLLAALDEALSPLGWGLVVAQSMLFQVLAGWTFWRLLRTVFGARPALLLPLGLYLASPLTVPAANWYAASLNTLPLLVVIPLALTSQVHLLRTGRARHALAAALWVVVGLAFFVKALLLVPALLLLTLALRHVTGERLSVRAALWRCRAVWSLLVVVVAVYVPLYLAAPTVQTSSGLQVPDDPADLVGLYGKGIGHVLVPGLVGGPWRWIGTDAPTALSNVRFLPMFFSWLVVGALVTTACVVRRKAGAVWLLVLLWACADLTFVAVGRLNQLDASLALESHYLAEAMPLAWFAVAWSFLPALGEPDRALRWSRLAWAPARRPALALGTALVVAVSSVASVHAFVVDRQSRAAAQAFVENARAELADAPSDLALYDRAVPETLLNGLFLDAARTSQVLAPVVPDRFGPGLFPPYSEDPQVFDDTGHLHRTQVGGVPLARSAGQPCGWLVEGTSRDLPLASAVVDLDWSVRVGYLATQAGPVTFRFGRTTLTAQLHRGLGQVVFPASGGGAVLTVSVPTGAVLCVGDAQVGNLKILS